MLSRDRLSIIVIFYKGKRHCFKPLSPETSLCVYGYVFVCEHSNCVPACVWLDLDWNHTASTTTRECVFVCTYTRLQPWWLCTTTTVDIKSSAIPFYVFNCECYPTVKLIMLHRTSHPRKSAGEGINDCTTTTVRATTGDCDIPNKGILLSSLPWGICKWVDRWRHGFNSLAFINLTMLDQWLYPRK